VGLHWGIRCAPSARQNFIITALRRCGGLRPLRKRFVGTSCAKGIVQHERRTGECVTVQEDERCRIGCVARFTMARVSIDLSCGVQSKCRPKKFPTCSFRSTTSRATRISRWNMTRLSWPSSSLFSVCRSSPWLVAAASPLPLDAANTHHTTSRDQIMPTYIVVSLLSGLKHACMQACV